MMRPVMVRMSVQMYAEVQRLAAQQDRSASWVVRRAVSEYLKKRSST